MSILNIFKKKQKQDITELKEIFPDFEDALLQEISLQSKMKIPKGMEAAQKGMHVNMVPMGLKGSIKVYEKDEHNRESVLYKIERGVSCIVSITSILTDEPTPLYAKAEEDSEIINVPAEKSIEWFSKYETWRKYVIDLYNLRIKDLIDKHAEVTVQHEEIVYKNKQIVDSINYARYIQKAVLPPEKMIKEYFSQHFIMYRPKDIVSGDFYWTKKEEDRICFAAADATGHGVPGAFMSMLGLSLMNEISYNFKGNAAEFLNLLREKIKIALRQSEYNNSPQDGFDVALCIFYPKQGKIDYAGANNSMFLARNEELKEIKADKMPVGVYFREKESFTNNSIDVSENDIIYLFSDGYRDQFGGPKNHKFSMKRFKEILLDIHLLNIDEQKIKLENIFDNWKGDKNQIDDVLVAGIKIVKSLKLKN